GERGPCCRADKTQGVRGRHNPDPMPGFGKPPQQVAGLVGGDPGAHAENDAGRHGVSAGQGSAVSTAVRSPSRISRSAIDSGFSCTLVSTSGPTYSSRPSPSWA